MSENSPIVHLTRRDSFSAAHRLWADSLSDDENLGLFGPCSYGHGHGHNYVLEVTLSGPINKSTGILVNLKEVRDVVKELIIDHVDHRHLNHDAILTRGINPTAENLVVLFWQVLNERFGSMLTQVCLRETEKNWVAYFGK